MLQVTKIFYFEMAHALAGYEGACKNIHGHSYELHVTVLKAIDDQHYLPPPGFIIDFKEIKKLVNEYVIKELDHKLLLSKGYLGKQSHLSTLANLVIWEAEPTAENILIFIRLVLEKHFSASIQLARLKLFETKDSYAEWLNTNVHR
ncbi:MAG TPA: 6-carboxytetrahydropterin synthase [Chitinophagaceae bacterium]|jgi:6-pyruvoyltetrahydropterin/6-carboxytetrahydropterin synthase|nr:6-carboxytetrahydropterin synthase [Chitinophagaceae bacterium]OPZ18502.1 MAG: 6-pyruvoyl tetrahydropterin synthase [Bacteroidetes bacterium ADurb.BinA245]HNA91020.1 6-carboxytetrahydropterin synthase [Chitinophagaceae bacterium]HNF46671.1 6-carboxytetrahydropterin synthase [Chitinophagaceae bacterium]HNL59610.1 6-carboxytetrahydropterin synthase [Chitinophagaceae bacterium]